MSTLSVTNVSKEFPTRGEPLQVLHDVSLELKAGENLAILGPSGCGKSTLLHLLGTLDAPTTGTIELNGQDPFQLEESQLARFRNENIGFIFQEHHLLPQSRCWNYGRYGQFGDAADPVFLVPHGAIRMDLLVCWQTQDDTTPYLGLEIPG